MLEKWLQRVTTCTVQLTLKRGVFIDYCEKGDIMLSRSGIDLSVCFYCKDSLDDYSRTVDHLYPKSRGGIRSNSNKVPCCGTCNKMKGDMSIDEFGRALSGLLFYEHTRHKESIARLKKIKINVDEFIVKRKSGKDER